MVGTTQIVAVKHAEFVGVEIEPVMVPVRCTVEIGTVGLFLLDLTAEHALAVAVVEVFLGRNVVAVDVEPAVEIVVVGVVEKQTEMVAVGCSETVANFVEVEVAVLVVVQINGELSQSHVWPVAPFGIERTVIVVVIGTFADWLE